MEGRCRSTTSTACTGLVLMGLSSSRGSGMLRPVSTSCSMCQLTRDTNLMETLKGRSLPPSPGRVTSRSTWVGKQRRLDQGRVHLVRVGVNFVYAYTLSFLVQVMVSCWDCVSVSILTRYHTWFTFRLQWRKMCVFSCVSFFQLTPAGATGSGLAVYKLFFPSYTGLRSPKIVTLKCCTIESTTSLHNTHTHTNWVSVILYVEKSWHVWDFINNVKTVKSTINIK